MKPLPVWCAEGTFLSWPGRKWEALQRTEGLQNRIPREVWRGDELRAEAPFVTQALLVPQGPYGRLPVYPCISPFFTLPPPRDKTVHVNESWAEWHGPQPISVEGNQLFSFFLFLLLLLSLFPSLKQYSSICIAFICTPIPLYSLLRRLGHSVKTRQQTAAPVLYSNPLSPLSLCPYGRLSDVTIVLLHCSWPEVDLSTPRRPYFIPMKERNEWRVGEVLTATLCKANSLAECCESSLLTKVQINMETSLFFKLQRFLLS